uniref:Uncharacterized protein n=1 Tax=Anguilla anguilla TaxID=7936 RepID=A0A0E9XQX4_ANGAN
MVPSWIRPCSLLSSPPSSLSSSFNPLIPPLPRLERLLRLHPGAASSEQGSSLSPKKLFHNRKYCRKCKIQKRIPPMNIQTYMQ